MKTGILADIHGHVENLRIAIDRLRREPVDLIVVLGDVIYDSRNAIETVALLRDCGAVGVWGNPSRAHLLGRRQADRNRFGQSLFLRHPCRHGWLGRHSR